MALRFSVRPATPEEFRVFGFWSQLQGWNKGVDDEKYLQIGAPTGLWLTVTDLADSERPDPADGPYDSDPSLQTRHIVATILCTEYTDTYSFLGNLIVRPEWRDQKVAMHMFQTCIMTKPKVFGINAVSSMVAVYQRVVGFTPAFEIVRFVGALPQRAELDVGLDVDAEGVKEASPLRIVPAGSLPHEAIMALDTATFGPAPATRSAFLAAWLSRQQVGAAALCLVDPDGRVVGLVASRPAHKGIRVGPLLAPDPHQAERLLYALSACLRPHLGAHPEFYIDVPNHFPDSVPLFTRLGLSEVTRLTRMYLLNKKMPAPAALPNTLYATTSSSIGP